MQSVGNDLNWRRSCDALLRSLQQLNRKTTIIRRSTNKLLSLSDMTREREKIRETTASVSETELPAIEEQMRVIERAIQLNSELNVDGLRLKNDAQRSLKEYEAACDNFYKRCIELEKSLRGKVAHNRASHISAYDSEDDNNDYKESSRRVKNNNINAMNDDDNDETHRLLSHDDEQEQQPQRQLLTQKMIFERDLYEELMAERQRETSEIAENVRDIHDIFQHINEMVGEQGEQLNVIDTNLSTAQRATHNATEHLRHARQHVQSSSRNKLLLFFIIALCIFVGLTLLRSETRKIREDKTGKSI